MKSSLENIFTKKQQQQKIKIKHSRSQQPLYSKNLQLQKYFIIAST